MSVRERNINELREIEQKLLRSYEHISEAFGIRGLKAKLLSVLFISAGQPRSLSELVDLTHFSKASISRGMRELEAEVPFIEAVKKPRDKEKYYRIEVEFMDIITGFLVKTVHEEAEPTLKATSEAIKNLKELKKSAKEPEILKEINSFITRTSFVNRTYKKYLWMVERMVTYIEQLEKEYEMNHSK